MCPWGHRVGHDWATSLSLSLFKRAPVPVASHGQPMPPPETPTLAGRFGLVLCEVTAPFPCVLVHARFCLCFLRVESLFPPVLWKPCNQILLPFKVRFPACSQSLCWIPRLGSLTWGSEPARQRENFFGTTVFQFVVCPPSGIRFDFIMIAPRLPSHCDFSFVFGLLFFFFGGFQSPVDS